MVAAPSGHAPGHDAGHLAVDPREPEVGDLRHEPQRVPLPAGAHEHVRLRSPDISRTGARDTKDSVSGGADTQRATAAKSLWRRSPRPRRQSAKQEGTIGQRRTHGRAAPEGGRAARTALRSPWIMGRLFGPMRAVWRCAMPCAASARDARAASEADRRARASTGSCCQRAATHL